jgi:D-alanine-D-alanine ligase
VKVKDLSDLPAAMDEALHYDNKVLIESAVIGVEIECAVLEIGGEAKASIPGKVWIDPHFEFYDFEAKYLDGATRIDIPAPLDPLVIKSIRESAIVAFKAIGACGLSRVDFFVTPTNEIIINEINTMPGFTSTSAFPKMWQASGVSYKEVISALLSQ